MDDFFCNDWCFLVKEHADCIRMLAEWFLFQLRYISFNKIVESLFIVVHSLSHWLMFYFTYFVYCIVCKLNHLLTKMTAILLPYKISLRLHLGKRDWFIQLVIIAWVTIFIVTHLKQFFSWIELLKYLRWLFSAAIIFFQSETHFCSYLPVMFSCEVIFFFDRTTERVLHSVAEVEVEKSMNW